MPKDKKPSFQRKKKKRVTKKRKLKGDSIRKIFSKERVGERDIALVLKFLISQSVDILGQVII